jgi:hypothetical protein
VGKFWQGLLWGGIAGTVLWAVMNPMSKQYRKPLEQSADMARDTAQDFIRGARRARKRIIKRMD